MRKLLERERLFVPLTVTLECAWVLRSFYKLSRTGIAEALTITMALRELEFEHAEGVAWSCERLLAGAEIDDMLHLVAAAAVRSEAFVTFDEGIQRRTGADPLIRVDVLA